MNLENQRTDYKNQELRRKDLLINPFDQFQVWLKEAQTAKVLEFNAMVLSTSTKAGQPSSRTVLLKHADEKGFIFFTNYKSRKAQEIEENPYVSAVFHWKEMERQVIIEGSVEKTSRDISEKYFAKRPRQSQLGTASSSQSTVIPTRKVLEEELSRLDQLYKDSEIPCPPFWGGFSIKPQYFEFWQGRPNRVHDRFRYKLVEGRWVIDRLSP